jgi:DNA-binding MarR family transcriptional regulator
MAPPSTSKTVTWASPCKRPDSASATACTVLTELGRAPTLTLAELAWRLRLDKGWTSRAVDQLVHAGLVDKATGDGDRRTIALSFTRAGRTEHLRIEGS